MPSTNWGTVVSFLMTDQKTYLKELGQRIQFRRKEAEMTQTEFGKLINLSQQVIADYEAGNRNIPIFTLAKMADVLNVDVGDLTGGEQAAQRKRGPAPRVQKQLEKIQALPKDRQNFIMQALDMALNSSGGA